MQAQFGEPVADRVLSLADLARDLQTDGRLSARDASLLQQAGASQAHPLVVLAERNLEDAAAPGRPLDMEALLAWCSRSIPCGSTWRPWRR